MPLGSLRLVPALQRPDLLADPVRLALEAWSRSGDVEVAEIDPEAADTSTLCERYGVDLRVSANCVVIAGSRAGTTTLAGCVVLATTRADVNGTARRRLGARKASFAAMDTAVEATGMEYGGITPIGLPAGWPLLVDPAVVATPQVVVGSGVRRSKLVVPGEALAVLPGADVLDGLAR